MTVVTPDRMIVEDEAADGPCGPRRALWISETGGLTQFGAFIEILPDLRARSLSIASKRAV